MNRSPVRNAFRLSPVLKSATANDRTSVDRSILRCFRLSFRIAASVTKATKIPPSGFLRENAIAEPTARLTWRFVRTEGMRPDTSISIMGWEESEEKMVGVRVLASGTVSAILRAAAKRLCSPESVPAQERGPVPVPARGSGLQQPEGLKLGTRPGAE